MDVRLKTPYARGRDLVIGFGLRLSIAAKKES
jgi:hypothetical protein